MYHFVCPAKYHRVVFSEDVDLTLKEICLEISKRYEIHFLEIGTDKDHVHFFVQSIPKYSPTKLVTIIKSITAREIFQKIPSVKEILLGSEFWSDGYFASTVGEHGNENIIQKYIKNQGSEKEYKKLHEQQPMLL